MIAAIKPGRKTTPKRLVSHPPKANTITRATAKPTAALTTAVVVSLGHDASGFLRRNQTSWRAVANAKGGPQSMPIPTMICGSVGPLRRLLSTTVVRAA
jgi:hypothetical protein